MSSLDVHVRDLNGDALAAELERVECASVLVCHPDLVTSAIRACADAGSDLMVRGCFGRYSPGEWELF